MIDPNDPPQIQIEKQAKIIDALVRRANRQKDVGPSAYRAFQSAIDLQQKVAAQHRELVSARYERERTRKALAEALSSMEEGFALFSDGRLNICNDLFRGLLPDISDQVAPGLDMLEYFRLMEHSVHLVSTDRTLANVRRMLGDGRSDWSVVSVIAEVAGDRWYQMSAQRTSPENCVLLMTDITALVRRNRMEKEHLIDRQADYLQAVFQNMSSGVCTFTSSGEVMMQNGRFREILGVPLTLLQPGTPLTKLLEFMRGHGLIAEDSMSLVEEWSQTLKARGWLRRRVNHGADRVLDVQANVLPDGGFLVELKDVTLETRSTELLENRVMERTAELTRANARLTEQYEEKARVEEELRLAKERAEAAVSSKTRFLAAASHDLLQPINAAKLLISTLQETTRDTKFRPMVNRLEGAFSSAEQLLHSLLDISRLESADPDAVTPSDVSLGSIMTGVRADQTLLASGKSVTLDVVPCSLCVRSDPVYLLRSIQNLVVNAIQYTEPGGRVLLGCRRRGGKVVLEVWDTGIGIAKKDQARIFEEFTRADNLPLGTGVGLGLSVVERACRLLGHKLSVRSKPGEGSVFSIEMEVVEGVTTPAEPADLAEEVDELGPDCIVMVIENDQDLLYGTTQWLEQWGASVMAAQSGRDALEHVTDAGMPPDVILADYHLDDGETGVDAIAAIREATGSQVPAILITADRSETLRRLSAEQNVSLMNKPVKLARLRRLIDWKVRRHNAEQNRAEQNRAEQNRAEQNRAVAPTKVGGDSVA